MSTTGQIGASSWSKSSRPQRKISRDQDSVSYQDNRDHWDSRLEFILACLGYSVGLGNLWQFPYLMYENGGAAFLIPYLVIFLGIGRPLYLMDVALGQYSQKGSVHTWLRITPLMGGLGYTHLINFFVIGPSYMLVIAYSLHYFFNSLVFIGQKLPWDSCSYEWSDANCYVIGAETPCSGVNASNFTAAPACTRANESSAMQYWKNEVLGIDSNGMEVFGDMGGVQTGLVFSLLTAWIITGFSLMYGIKSSGKVMYFTATFPFLVLLILSVVGVRLEGSLIGLHYLFIPKWEKILEVHVWGKAAAQVFCSLSFGGSVLITFGSYNSFNRKIHVDVMILSVLDLVASLLSAITVFSVLGAMAHELGMKDINSVVASGLDLAFVAYPQAISRTLPFPHLWSALFFFMIFTLGLDSMFGALENVLAYVLDEHQNMRRKKPLVVAGITLLYFIIGLPYCTRKGHYLFFLVDVFMARVGGLLFGFLTCVAVNWVYGVRKFCDDFEFMLSFRPSIALQIVWAALSPVTLLALFVGSMYDWKWPLYGGKISYPSWAYATGGILPIVVLTPTLVMMVLHVVDMVSLGKWRAICDPIPRWGPGDPVARQRLNEQRRLAQEELARKIERGEKEQVESKFLIRISKNSRDRKRQFGGIENPSLDVDDTEF